MHVYELITWPDGALTRRRSSDPPSPGEVSTLHSNVSGDATIAFVTSAGDDPRVFRLHEIAVSSVPFSTYDLADLPPSALAVIPTPPNRKTGTMSPLRALPPRGLQLERTILRAPTQLVRVEYRRNNKDRIINGPATVAGKKLPLNQDTGFSLFAV
jgi:hypothetical protein